MRASIRSLVRTVAFARLWKSLRTLKAKAHLHAFHSELASYPSRWAEHDYGVPLEIWIADPVAEEWYDHDWPASDEITFLQRSRLKSGARVFDPGAHQGVVALQLAQVVGPSGQVLAVEAHPHNADVGERNRVQNGCRWLEILKAAVGDRPGSLALVVTMLNAKIGQVGGVGRVAVPAVTIDRLAEDHGTPDVVFLDVEGYECAALRGARRTLASAPDLLIEVHAECGLEELGGSVEKLLASIPSDVYDLFFAPGTRDGVAYEAGEFVPWRLDLPGTRSRFFLAAIRGSILPPV